MNINLYQNMLDIHDPSKNLTVYKGVTGLDYANGTYHHFELSQVEQVTGKIVVQNFFFDTTTMRLKYV